MAISPIGGSSSGLAPTPKSSQLGQEDFLSLMIAQFQNQDPFKPMENGDFLGQMAQFSTVSGLDELNDRFANLAGSINGDQSLAAAQLIGHEALFESNQIHLAEAGEDVSAALPEAHAGAVTITVTDAAGQQVRSFNVDAREEGINRFAWDGRNDRGGKAPVGDYRIRAYAQIDGQQTEVPMLVAARITGVSLGGSQGPSLNVQGLPSQSLSDVRQISEFGAKE